MLAIACMISMMMRKYKYCLDTCSLYVSGDTYIRRKKIWMDGDGYRGKDTRPHTVWKSAKLLWAYTATKSLKFVITGPITQF